MAKSIEYLHSIITHPTYALGSLKYAWFPWIPAFRKRCNPSYYKSHKLFPDRIIPVNFKGRVLQFHVPAGNGYATFYEILGESSEYKDLNVKGKKVLDIGGTWGDAAIYFSLKGADEVISYEIVKEFCACAEDNFARNHISNSRMMNEAASSKTIDAFAKKFANYPKVMKIDCEGAEYEMISNAKTLRDYEEIILEYHDGYSSIKKELESQGFKVSVAYPEFLCVWADKHLSLCGIMYATNATAKK
jgi:predicted RNA methylase